MANMTAGQRVELVCQSSGSRPPAKISWRKNEKILEHYSESTSDDGAVTTNFLTFVPTKEDNGKLLVCAAYNPQFSYFRIENALYLDVHCNYDLQRTVYIYYIPCVIRRCTHSVIAPRSKCTATGDSRRK